jgi:hypothetical protein
MFTENEFILVANGRNGKDAKDAKQKHLDYF